MRVPTIDTNDASRPAHTRPRLLERTLLGLILLNVTLSALLYTAVPSWRPEFTEEDHFVENCTVCLYLMAFLLAGYFAIRARKAGHSGLAWIVSVLALLCLLDETSFGERVFGLTMPVVNGLKID